MCGSRCRLARAQPARCPWACGWWSSCVAGCWPTSEQPRPQEWAHRLARLNEVLSSVACNRPTLLDEFRRSRDTVALGFVVVDPELRVLLGEDCGDFVHRLHALLSIEVSGGDPSVDPVLFEVHHV